MSNLSSHYPRPVRTGVVTATSGVNDFQNHAVEKNPAAEKSVFFVHPSTGKIASHPLTGENGKVSRTCSPFGGSWDYSEVD